MRAGIRQALIDNIPELSDCYEPNVPSKQTLKPYAVILQGNDEEVSAHINFSRNIEIWLYEKRTTFKKLDYLYDKIVEILHLKTIIDPVTNESFTCVFNGTIGQDVIDEEWDAIARGLSFKIIGLHNDNYLNSVDEWVEAISKYSEMLVKTTVYRDCFKNSIETPSILWRATDTDKKMINSCILNVEKTLVCHVISNNRKQIQEIINTIMDDFAINIKIPLDLASRKFLTITNISENKTADMFTNGQLIIKLISKFFVNKEVPMIETIYSNGKIE